ncbi:SEC14-like protein 4 [Orchesella cincta]|uniref:SEC14-like protein 4 n=1 Tax=Orchesella cincta TaxID=48709 RepID=A0A1D2NH99_ORCCI|nr:SEC14-like protein 4 [Orchesella cincta]
MAFLDEKKELKYVEQFRSAVKDLGRDDGTLRRFLRARDYDLNKAEEMLRKTVSNGCFLLLVASPI